MKLFFVNTQLKVQYTAKLIKENGELIDSNGKAPYRFRLGTAKAKQIRTWMKNLTDNNSDFDTARLCIIPELKILLCNP